MTGLPDALALAAIACVASAVQAAFGAALVLIFVAANDWAGVLPSTQAVALASALSCVNAAAAIRAPLAAEELRQAAAVTGVALASLLAISWALHALTPAAMRWPRLACAGVIIAIGLANARGARIRARPAAQRVAAAASGLLGAVVGVPGPPLALYLQGSRPVGSPWNVFFVSLVALAGARLLLSVGQLGLAGIAWLSLAGALAGVQAGALLGRGGAARLTPARRRRAAGLLIVASGASIAITALTRA